MKLRHIEVFHALMRCGSVSAAARHLNVSQPSVTRVLAHAEASLGVRLFDRHARGMTPTPEAQRLWPNIESMVGQLDALEQLGQQLRHGVDRHLRLGASHTLGLSILPQAVIDLQREMPALHIELATSHFSTLCEELVTHRLDLALAFEQPLPTGIAGEPLAQAPMQALVPREMTAPASVSLAWLHRRGLIAMPGDDPLGRRLDEALTAAGLDDTAPRLRVRTYSLIAELVIAGGGTGVVDPLTAERYREQVQIVPLDPPLEMSVTLLHAEHTPLSHPGQRLRELLYQRLSVRDEV
ncbi:LysR family transcriptional regulator [Kushneria aurantia]|uniref:LysR family transcriptional regulator n=1 Tax=Kushneria aurantia TaxID=504092 RepID=A0ABV6G7Z1_9GAMM|nr:LysR family transcriptional regulator [Kushneria aurantia]